MLRKVIIPFFIILFAFTGCCMPSAESPSAETQAVTTAGDIQESESLFKGAWISYFELNRSGRSEEEYREYMRGLFENMKAVSVTDVFLHVRAAGDAAYVSGLFPPAEYICGEEKELPFDVLEMALGFGEQYGMNIHAWINPYRAFSEDDTESLPVCRLKTLLEDEKINPVKVNGKNYLNPASDEVRTLIIDGVREILSRYPDVRGIHIDDYFYPEGCGNFDKAEYESYISDGGKLSLYDFRRENVNSLVSGIYAAVKNYGSDKIFSVSPSGDIDKNYNTLYADVSLWCSVGGYCDMIIPQIYFGFENEAMPFEKTVDRWALLTENSSTRLVIGLALYKCGTEDAYAGDGGKNEWLEHSDIIKRQVEYIRQKNLHGFSLYSASFINFSESFLSEEVNNLKSVL
ncbi:MAG: family 10 glycosylhydrolase [Clostridia bacterium]|nr:family 10 glycosylhydrolase [Clostridia bacterium]